MRLFEGEVVLGRNIERKEMSSGRSIDQEVKRTGGKSRLRPESERRQLEDLVRVLPRCEMLKPSGSVGR